MSEPVTQTDDSAAAALEDWLQRLEVLHPTKIDLSLDRVKAVLQVLDLERPSYRVLTIGGTNGKGSCVAMLETIYRLAGYRVAAYTSPHLLRFNERVRIGGADATNTELVALFEEIDRARGPTSLSYFEYATVAACLHFAQQDAQIAILEVGLGGRLDAVNALDADLALVASIDLDHQHWLGDTREAIGLEKAGIFRPGRPAIMGDRDPPKAVLEYADTLGAQLWRAGLDFECVRHDDDYWDYRGRCSTIAGLPRPSLPGQIQYDNAAACLAAVEAMQSAMPVASGAIAAALQSVRLSGRLERAWIGAAEWIFDVAHNPAAAALLAQELTRRPAAGRTFAIVGFMADKDISGVLRPFVGLVDEWLTTQAETERAAQPQVLISALEALGCGPARPVDNAALASVVAAAEVQPGDRVVVFGSFQIVGPVMAALKL